MKTYGFSRRIFFIVCSAGGIFLSAVFVSAQQVETSPVGQPSTAVQSALADVSALYGAPVTSVVQAGDICSLEKFLVECAVIGKRHNLYSADEVKNVDVVLDELKGSVVNDLKACTTESCLADVASRLATRITAKNPSVAAAVDLTPQKVKEKQTIIEAAVAAGVSARECSVMDPDTASVDLLRSCAKLAKDTRVQKYIPTAQRALVGTIDTAADLKSALERGEYQCGNNTPDGCGSFCLNPSADTRARGSDGIPSVCRSIAEKFFGSRGVQELENAYKQVTQVSTYYAKRAAALTFTTIDGAVLRSPEEIGGYMEEQGRKGNVAAVEKGMGFLVTNGFVKQADSDFAVAMVTKVRERGGIETFDGCRDNAQACADFVPDSERTTFDASQKIDAIVRVEMKAEGIADPQLCENSKNGDACIRATKRALPQLEALVQTLPAAQGVIDDMRRHVAFAEQSVVARTRAEQEFQKTGSTLTLGEKTFSNFSDMEAYCRVNGEVCLTEAVKRGFIEKEFAAKKYEAAYAQQQKAPVFNQSFPEIFPVISPLQGREGGVLSIRESNQSIVPGFTLPQPGSGVPPGLSKEEALKRFKEWLDNPQGPAPVPGFGVPQQTQPYYPYPQERYPEQQQSCPSIPGIVQPPCPDGQYRQENRDARGCFVSYGSCVVKSQTPNQPLDRIQTCPALPSVSSCSSSEERYATFSSAQCGTYYACRPRQDSTIPPSPPSCPSGQYWFYPPSGAPYCRQSEGTYASTTVYRQCDWNTQYLKGATNECLPKTNCASPSNPEYGTSECVGIRSVVSPQPPNSSTWVRKTWTFSDGTSESSYILNRTDGEYSALIASVESQCKQVLRNRFSWRPNAGSDAASNWQNFGIPDCSGNANTSSSSVVVPVPPAGQREQVWNAQGLRSWVRADANAARIEELKRTCSNVSGSANVWMSDAGNQSNVDFGMPSPDKCARAAACTTGQYFDGSTCSTGTVTAYPGGGSSCSAVLKQLLGDGCHYMYNDSLGKSVYCDGPMTKSAKDSDGTAVPGCSGGSGTSGTSYAGDANSCPGFSYSRLDSQGRRYCQLNSERRCDYTYPSYLTNGGNYTVGNCPATDSGAYASSSCPSGQSWNGSACTTVGYQGQSCPSYQAWDTATQTCKPIPNSTTSGSQCPSFAHEMGGYCMLNTDTLRCAEYGSANTEGNYSSVVCTQRTGSQTTGTQTSGSCPSGQYWFYPSGGAAPYCRSSNTTESSQTCPSGSNWYTPSGGGSGYCQSSNTSQTASCSSGQWWDSSTNTCRSSTATQSCPSGQWWDPSSNTCKSSSTQTCGSNQYWNGSACVDNPTATTQPSGSTSCTSGQYWNGSACVATSPTPDPAAGCASSGGTWNGSSCQFPQPAPTSGKKESTKHFFAEILTIIRRIIGK